MKQWIRVGSVGTQTVAICDVCGAKTAVPSRVHLSAFATAHRAHESTEAGWMGAGDVVHAAASKLGIESCTPCEKRRRRMNKMVPKFMRRK